MRKKSKKTIIIRTAIVVLALAITAAAGTGLFFLIRHITNHQGQTLSGSLYEKVQNYDYSKGHNKDIEKEIKESLEKNYGTEDSTEYITTLKAKAEYYFSLQKYNTAVATFKELESYVSSGDDIVYLYQHLADAYDKFGNSEKAEEYQTMYDTLTKKCTAGSDSAEAQESDSTENQESAPSE